MTSELSPEIYEDLIPLGDEDMASREVFFTVVVRTFDTTRKRADFVRQLMREYEQKHPLNPENQAPLPVEVGEDSHGGE